MSHSFEQPIAYSFWFAEISNRSGCFQVIRRSIQRDPLSEKGFTRTDEAELDFLDLATANQLAGRANARGFGYV